MIQNPIPSARRTPNMPMTTAVEMIGVRLDYGYYKELPTHPYGHNKWRASSHQIVNLPIGPTMPVDTTPSE